MKAYGQTHMHNRTHIHRQQTHKDTQERYTNILTSRQTDIQPESERAFVLMRNVMFVKSSGEMVRVGSDQWSVLCREPAQQLKWSEGCSPSQGEESMSIKNGPRTLETNEESDDYSQ